MSSEVEHVLIHLLDHEADRGFALFASANGTELPGRRLITQELENRCYCFQFSPPTVQEQVAALQKKYPRLDEASAMKRVTSLNTTNMRVLLGS